MFGRATRLLDGEFGGTVDSFVASNAAASWSPNEGNPKVKQAILLLRFNRPILSTKLDLILYIRLHVENLWITQWQKQKPSNKLDIIKSLSSVWNHSNQLLRQHEIILTHLRIDHTRV